MIIIGIDPGTRVTGYGVISFKSNKIEAIDFGCIRTTKAPTSSARYKIIFESIALIPRIEFVFMLGYSSTTVHPVWAT